MDNATIERVEKYLHERAEMRSVGCDLIHGLHAGDAREADLTMTDLRALVADLARYRAALQEIADMDAAGLRADDLGRAARIATRALKGE